MASYFPEAGNLNGSNTDMCSDVAGRSRVAARATCFGFQISLDPVVLLFPPLLAQMDGNFWILT